jgi:predicted NBD/HSP70 family sugar kinase
MTLQHDVRAAALAEVRTGAVRGRAEVLHIAIGTGLAGALVTGGSLVQGAAGLAGEIGHVPVVPDGGRCATVIGDAVVALTRMVLGAFGPDAGTRGVALLAADATSLRTA